MKKRLSSTLAKAREARDTKKRRITEVAQLEATGPRVAEEAAQPEASGSSITEEVAQTGAPGSSSHLPTAQLPPNDTPLSGTQQQVGFLSLELPPSLIIHFCLFVRRPRPISTNLWRNVERAAKIVDFRSAIEM